MNGINPFPFRYIKRYIENILLEEILLNFFEVFELKVCEKNEQLYKNNHHVKTAQFENTIKFNCISNKYIYINHQRHPLSLLQNTDMCIVLVWEKYIAIDFCRQVTYHTFKKALKNLIFYKCFIFTKAYHNP